MTSLGPWTSAGWNRDAGSGTASPSSRTNLYKGPALQVGLVSSYQPSSALVIGTRLPSLSTRDTFVWFGAHRRKRTPPSTIVGPKVLRGGCCIAGSVRGLLAC